jgi:hypothetical protein
MAPPDPPLLGLELGAPTSLPHPAINKSGRMRAPISTRPDMPKKVTRKMANESIFSAVAAQAKTFDRRRNHRPAVGGGAGRAVHFEQPPACTAGAASRFVIGLPA